jgi:hypothetical protein
MDPFANDGWDQFSQEYADWLRETGQDQPPTDEPEPDWVGWQDRGETDGNEFPFLPF